MDAIVVLIRLFMFRLWWCHLQKTADYPNIPVGDSCNYFRWENTTIRTLNLSDQVWRSKIHWVILNVW